MGYLLPAQYQQYGLNPETDDALIDMASALIEAHCRRPSLMATQYIERTRLSCGSQTMRLSYGPLPAGALLSGRVRYAKPRRGEDDGMHPFGEGTFITEVATAFGLPGSWAALDLTTVDLYPFAREVTFTRDFFGLGYNEVELTYMAGLVTVPDRVCVACAQIVRNAEAIPALNVKGSRLDTLAMQYFSGELIDANTAELLKPFRAERL